MKTYEKPMIEFIELKPEERLACVSSGNQNKGKSFSWWCPKSFPCGNYCKVKWYSKCCR